VGKFAFALVSEVVLVPIVLIGGFFLEVGEKDIEDIMARS